ncbi:MAG TPA: alpha/beta hydrolase [Vicinamibacterales bacterium]|nr:alpha/beta hydrolase [Vicinamibacterales bacterium]
MTIAIVCAAVVAAYWALLFFAQRSMLFPAPPAAGAPPRPQFAEPVWLATSVGRVEAWYLPPIDIDGQPAPMLLFTHGNGELIDYWPDEFDQPRKMGMAVLLVEYPGYGRSDGAPSEGSITEGVVAAYDWAAQQPQIDKTRIIPYGRSLGGGAATALSRARPVPAVILESAFSSVAAFASGFGAPKFLLRDRFDNEAAIASFKGPVLIVHGDRDTIVPPAHARVLAAASPNTTLRYLPCGHNDCRRPWNEVITFLLRFKLI